VVEVAGCPVGVVAACRDLIPDKAIELAARLLDLVPAWVCRCGQARRGVMDGEPSGRHGEQFLEVGALLDSGAAVGVVVDDREWPYLLGRLLQVATFDDQVSWLAPEQEDGTHACGEPP